MFYTHYTTNHSSLITIYLEVYILKIGIIADIHSNREALEAVLDELINIEQFYCMGDIIGYGADPIYCVEKMKKINCLCIKGNHEGAITGELDLYYFNEYAKQSLEWTMKQLRQQELHYIHGLPKKVDIAKDILGVHGSPRQPLWEYILDEQTAEEIFNKFDFKICFIGHSHVPGYFTFHRKNRIIKYFEATAGADLVLDDEHSYIVNCGSVGQPRDGNPQASYVLYDSEKGTIYIKRVSYPINTAQKKIIKANLPNFLAERLALGI